MSRRFGLRSRPCGSLPDVRPDPVVIALREKIEELEETIRQLRAEDVIPAWNGLRVTPSERALLSTLAARRGICSNTYLLNRLPSRREVFPKALDVVVCRLRKKLRALEPPILIETAWGGGYLMDDANRAMLAERRVKSEGNPA